MPNLNQVNVIGHLTRDPELRYTPNSTAVAHIGLAVNRAWEDAKGNKKTEVCFLDVVAWARLAEICNEFLKKGDPAFFAGRLRQESWVDPQTQDKRSKLVIVAESMQLLTRKEESARSTPHAQPAKPRQNQPPAPAPAAVANDPDEIPF